MGLSVTLSEFACFVFRSEQHRQENNLTDEQEVISLEYIYISSKQAHLM